MPDHQITSHCDLCVCLADFVWSLSNDVILSVSKDGTARLWDVAAGSCMRVMEDGAGAELWSCLFQPLNNNMFVVSFACSKDSQSVGKKEWREGG